jgi:molecular chaperone GrpE
MSEENTTPNSDQNTETNTTESASVDLTKDLQQMTLTAQRALADLTNFKQQVAKERQLMGQMAQIKVLEMFFPVIDNFNLAVRQTPEHITNDNWYKGIENIYKMLNKITTNMGLSPVPNDKLDSSLHEVISTIPGEKDTIIETLEQGYLLGEKVIRPSKVVVGSGE